MPDFLLELFSEEIPARMQALAAKDLERLVVGALSDRGLLFDGAKAFAGPRRLTLALTGLPAKQPDVSEEKKGPRVGAPEKAIEGFLRGAGVTLAQCRKQSDGKGEFYVAVVARKGRATPQVLAELLPETLAQMPWPKSMRFPGSAVRWVRPLHAIVATFDGEVVPFAFAGIESGSTTMGHRFLSRGPIEVRRFEDYEQSLRAAHVLLDGGARKDIVRNALKQQAFALGLEPIEDEGLLDEVAGLAEWPLVLIGRIEERFMDLPPEILQTAMRRHQKYFSLRHAPSFEASLRDAPQDDEKGRHPEVPPSFGTPARHAEVRRGAGPRSTRGLAQDGVAASKGDGRMAPRFAVVANMIAPDGGKTIVEGNERVLRARLSDARFFWDQDRATALANRVGDLKGIVFHAKAGTQYERATRITLLAMLLARLLETDVAQAHRAGLLCKADLTTGTVGEFPELQGTMGRYYALADGEDEAVADAIAEHYRPLGPSDAVPAKPVSRVAALADKLDTLIFLWRAGERPTGSKDPFALRRTALGIIRIVLENGLRLPLVLVARLCYALADAQRLAELDGRLRGDLSDASLLRGSADELLRIARETEPGKAERAQWEEILAFIADRLKVALRDKGTRHDLIDAVFSLGSEDDLVRLVARVEALQTFLGSDDGANLLTAYRRAANILKAEEKKDKKRFDGEPDPEALVAPEEKTLYVELAAASEMLKAEVARERFVEAMAVMARLRKPVDAFFDKVTVNDKDARLRENRLKLLARLRTALHQVADFSKVEG
ncbi:MAG: glycine--tRNA ligase subunit beta [Alphaproteobacteria bacterium]|nr:glycine--tRNA ligase subunit beta [Alphaproteobacteria bacterium]MBV9694354.1 glycine--tRNA ligase subunit beta [Alphaproteobacteria bacterium]